MSLLDEIRSDLVDQSAGLSNTLRKAKILASATGLPEFREWVDFELSGYPDRDKVPRYRRFRPTNLGTFARAFNSGVKNMVLPTYNLPAEIKDFAENLIFLDGVGALEAQASGSHQQKWTQEMILIARDAIPMTGDMVLIDAHQPVPAHVVSGVLDQVKNRLLDFVLRLQESNITFEDLGDRAVKPEIVQNIFNNIIYGDRNVVASGEHINQRVETVQEGNISSLLSVLRGLNIDDDDLRELESAVSTEPDPSENSYGPKVQAWLGSMISKATAKTWDLGVQTATKALKDALNSFYGF